MDKYLGMIYAVKTLLLFVRLAPPKAIVKPSNGKGLIKMEKIRLSGCNLGTDDNERALTGEDKQMLAQKK